ncbi:hypothetical protein S83_047620, partial [Arachis hypogaea]
GSIPRTVTVICNAQFYKHQSFFKSNHPNSDFSVIELKKQSSCLVHIVNKSDQYVTFKVKTTSPKKYCVRPNLGIIKPKETCDFTAVYTQHQLHSENHEHSHAHLPSKTILIAIAAATTVTSSNKNGACKDKNPRGLHDTSSRLIASAKLSISSSPDVKGGCLQGGNLSRSPAAPKFKGVQVFTYKEIEVATNGFSEANVIGNGGTETRLKIGAGVKMGWDKRLRKKMLQEACCFEWQNLIAEASRKGYAKQEELQWNSYGILDKQLKQEWSECVEQRKQMVRPPGSKRAPKSPEQRRKTAEAIAAKWADPYRRGNSKSRVKKNPPTKLISENAASGYTTKLQSDARYVSQTMKFGSVGLPPYRAYSLEEIEVATNNFDSARFMGEGSQGQ